MGGLQLFRHGCRRQQLAVVALVALAAWVLQSALPDRNSPPAAFAPVCLSFGASDGSELFPATTDKTPLFPSAVTPKNNPSTTGAAKPGRGDDLAGVAKPRPVSRDSEPARHESHPPEPSKPEPSRPEPSKPELRQAEERPSARITFIEVVPTSPAPVPEPVRRESADSEPGLWLYFSKDLQVAAAAPAPATDSLVPAADDAIIPVGCSSCAGGGGTISRNGPNPLMMSGGGCGAGCVPLRKPCSSCDSKTIVGRFLCGVYECICCPDPCYDPRWTPITDAAFFVAAPRPITQTRFRWDSGLNVILLDRAEYFWARADGMGLGPFPTPPYRTEKRVNYNELSMYTEAAASHIAIFFNMPYRSIQPEIANGAAGFGDIDLGTKTLLFDCELFQVGFQFKTYILSGNFAKGLGNGHISLEPSILFGLRLGPETYVQTQVAEWIPFGTPGYSGAVFHYHLSVNQTMCRILPDVPLIGTVELNGYTFQNGAYTDPILGSNQKASGETYFMVGPGFRTVICDKLDFGIGMSFAVSDEHWADQLYRSEVRFRF